MAALRVTGSGSSLVRVDSLVKVAGNQAAATWRTALAIRPGHRVTLRLAPVGLAAPGMVAASRGRWNSRRQAGRR